MAYMGAPRSATGTSDVDRPALTMCPTVASTICVPLLYRLCSIPSLLPVAERTWLRGALKVEQVAAMVQRVWRLGDRARRGLELAARSACVVVCVAKPMCVYPLGGSRQDTKKGTASSPHSRPGGHGGQQRRIYAVRVTDMNRLSLMLFIDVHDSNRGTAFVEDAIQVLMPGTMLVVRGARLLGGMTRGGISMYAHPL